MTCGPRDAGSWMADRFEGMRIPLFEDALRLAREKNIRLILDMKDKGIGPDVLQLLQREGMLERVRFGGEWADVKELYPRANEEQDAWVQPGVTAEQVKAYHRAGKVGHCKFFCQRSRDGLSRDESSGGRRRGWH